MYAVNGSDLSVQHTIGGVHEWNNVYMSSMLRALQAPNLPCPVMRVVRELKTPEVFEEFLQVAQNIFQRDCKLNYEMDPQRSKAFMYHSMMQRDKHAAVQNSFSFGQLRDPATQGVNLMVHHIVNYMIKYRMIDQCLQFLLPLTSQDPRMVTYICDCYMALDRDRDAVILLASKIKDYPYLVPLLQKQVEAFLKMELFEYALKIATMCVELCPESFEARICLAKCQIYEKDLRQALITLNNAPCYDDPNANW